MTTTPQGLQLDLLRAIQRIEQTADEVAEHCGITAQRLATCDAPRLRKYLTPQTIAWADEVSTQDGEIPNVSDWTAAPHPCAGYLRISRQALGDTPDLSALVVAALNAPSLTAEQHAARQREQDERDARNWATYGRLCGAGGLVENIADLHRPDSGQCVCDDQPWPCDTAQALIDHQEDQ